MVSDDRNKNSLERDLDTILQSRYEPHKPLGMEERIMMAARSMPQESGVRSRGARVSQRGGALGVFDSIRAVLNDLVAVPHPVAVMAVALVIGFSLGLYGEDFSTLPSMTTQDISSFMLIEDHFVASEFLNDGSL